MEKEIADYFSKLLLEEQPDKWIVIVAEIFNRFGPKAIDNIIKAIKEDSLTEPDKLGIVSLQNSAKWNSLALTYYQKGFLKEALAIFRALLAREPNNSATQNNYSIALIAVGDFGGAEEFLRKAFETDKKRALEQAVITFETEKGLATEQAKRLPAYRNLLLLEQAVRDKRRPPTGRAQAAGSPSFHNILFMDIVGFSRPSWYGTIQVEKITYLVETVRTLLGRLGLNYIEVPMLHTGDGMALFFENVELPINLAIELTRRLNDYNTTQMDDVKVELRIGIHAGDSFPVDDLHGGGNRCGPAINTARRVLDLGQARHILCTSEYSNRLRALFGPVYAKLVHDCGEYTVKHDEKLHICNIYDGDFGNPNCPPP